MKKIITIAVALLLLASCGGGYNPPSNPGQTPNTPNSGNTGGNSGGTSTTTNPVASFSYETTHPFYAHFKNTSKNATSYEWDFGDGAKSTDASPTHKYSGKGVYKVTLKAKYAGVSKQDVYTKNITIIEPTTCYITSIEYKLIPKNNEYYNIRFTDDYFLFETLYWRTDWVMLSSANMPYTYTLNPKRELDFSNSKHVMRLYKNSNTSGMGTQVAAWEISTSNVKTKFPETQTGTTDNAQVVLSLEWSD